MVHRPQYSGHNLVILEYICTPANTFLLESKMRAGHSCFWLCISSPLCLLSIVSNSPLIPHRDTRLTTVPPVSIALEYGLHDSTMYCVQACICGQKGKKHLGNLLSQQSELSQPRAAPRPERTGCAPRCSEQRSSGRVPNTQCVSQSSETFNSKRK